jgi:hypothetical protein
MTTPLWYANKQHKVVEERLLQHSHEAHAQPAGLQRVQTQTSLSRFHTDVTWPMRHKAGKCNRTTNHVQWSVTSLFSWEKKVKYNIGWNSIFGVLTAVTMKITVFWDVTPCSLVERYQCFGRTCCFHLKGGGVTRPSWRWRHKVPPES